MKQRSAFHITLPPHRAGGNLLSTQSGSTLLSNLAALRTIAIRTSHLSILMNLGPLRVGPVLIGSVPKFSTFLCILKLVLIVFYLGDEGHV